MTLAQLDTIARSGHKHFCRGCHSFWVHLTDWCEYMEEAGRTVWCDWPCPWCDGSCDPEVRERI